MRSYRVFLFYLAVTAVAAAALVALSCGDDPAPTEIAVPLTVVSTTPASSQENVPTSVIISATFSHDLDSSTVTGASFFVEPGVPGNVSCAESTAIFLPAPGSLELNTVYQVNLTTDITSVDGRPLANDYAWVFRTESDSVESLVKRYEVALNSHDTSRIGALMLDDFLHNGRDKACYLDYLKQSFIWYPAAAFSLSLVAKTAKLDTARIVLQTTGTDAGLTLPYTDTLVAVRLERRWYLLGDGRYFTPRIVVARYSNSDRYSVSPAIDDNSGRATLIEVMGTLLPTLQRMASSGANCTDGLRWRAQTLYLDGHPPTPLPLTYSYLVMTPYGNERLDLSSSDYFGEYAEPVFPVQTDTVNGQFTFTFHRIPGYQNINYGIELGNGWEKYTDFEDTTLVYDGPALTGDSAHYYLKARPRDMSAYSAKSVYFQIR